MHQKPYSSSGTLHYSEEPYKLIVEVDPQISEYYRWFIPKSIRTNRQMYAPHISVVRKEIPVNLDCWKAYEGHSIEFIYGGWVFSDEVYFWINAESKRLREIRVELGLPETKYGVTAPPDGSDSFHITIANTKNL